MKKKILAAVIMVACGLAVYSMSGPNGEQDMMYEIASANVKAFADDDKCPNGCLDKVGKCHCYKDYDYKEAGEAILE